LNPGFFTIGIMNASLNPAGKMEMTIVATRPTATRTNSNVVQIDRFVTIGDKTISAAAIMTMPP
jgi:hypothetical protein